ncbi:PQQ-binding-like beta-propeller repeat protein [Streptomyces sp. NPDC058045]|uniref:outer membrane protein assembly factor BamB family protein n=1 Tax=Streptomyces sp. NPDC058045 TaxID=3346311 RepID=UPI0036E447CE
MTQPPNQPPQGGFGAPQDPRQGGAQQPPPPPAGPPSQPPTQPAGPGYGYPQQPPTPQPQPGYGYPGQQPTAGNPYAQPTQPGQPGPYGQPQQPGPYGQPQYGQQPGYPGAPGGPGGSGGGPFKGKTAMIICAAVAGLLLIGGGVWAFTGKDDDKKPVAEKSDPPKPTGSAPVDEGDGSGDGGGGKEDLNAGRKPGEAKVLWFKEAPPVPGNGGDAPGMWITDKVAAKAAFKQIVGYDIEGGAPSWKTITFPQPICAATREASSDHKIVVAYKEGTKDTAACNQMVQIDLETGKKGWTQTVKETGLFDSALSLQLSIVGDKTLMVGRSQSATAYNFADGKKLFTKKHEDGACFPSGFATGDNHLLSVLSCAASKSNEHDEVHGLDPRTGSVQWKKALPKGWRLERVYSVNPVVLYSTNEDKKQWNITTLKPGSSATRSEVSVDEKFSPQCGWAGLNRDLQGCTGVVADNDALYLPTETKSGANEIVAISLATGKEAWRVKAPGDTAMLPMKRDDSGALIAYAQPTYDNGGAVLSIPLTGTHKPTKLLQNPEHTSSIENGFYSKAIDWVDGRFYISTNRLSGSDKAQEKLMMAFGK